MALSGYRKSLELARQLYVGLLDLVFPPYCKGCAQRLEAGDKVICSSCWSNLQPTHLGNFRERVTFRADMDYVLTGWFMNDILETVIYGLKYHEKRVLGQEVGKRLAHMFRKEIRQLSVDAVVPVPLYGARLRERGFNQSDLMGKTIADCLDLPYRPALLKRVRNTKSQTELSLVDRRENVSGAFVAGDLAEHARFMVVDDVLTSGATLSSCAGALKCNGAEFVAVVTAGTPPMDPFSHPVEEG